MNELTAEVIIEEYRKGLPNAGLDVNNENLKFVQAFHSGSKVWNFLTKEGDVLKTNEIAIFPKRDENLYQIIVGINKKIGRRLSCAQINADVLDDEERKLLEKEGYQFEENKYVGVKNLK